MKKVKGNALKLANKKSAFVGSANRNEVKS
jgi:hypothetical protein